MKRWLPSSVLILLLTGCGQSGSHPSFANETANPASVNVTQSGNVGAVNADGGVSHPEDSNSPGVTGDEGKMRAIAQRLIKQYVLSHNDRTLAQYAQDVRKTFVSGLAELIVPAASSGVDYNHPVVHYKTNILAVSPMGPQSFSALTELSIQYRYEPLETHQYLIEFVQDNKRWYIAKL